MGMLIAANANTLTVKVQPDGVANVAVIDLAKAPFNMNFNGRLPSALQNYSDNIGGGGTPVVVLSGTIITITWPTPPTANASGAVNFDLVY